MLTMDEKVAGIVTWKAVAGENLNFAVPSKLVTALLAHSTVRPFGSGSKTDSFTEGLLVIREDLWFTSTNRTNQDLAQLIECNKACCENGSERV